MSNKKRTISRDDYTSCYQYFHRAIQNNRFLNNEQYDAIRVHAIHAFSELNSEANSEESVRLFQLWLDNFVDSTTWGRCYRALNQKKYLVKNQQRTITINNEAYKVLKKLAHQNKVGLSQIITDGCALLHNKGNHSITPIDTDLVTEPLRALHIRSTATDPIPISIVQEHNNVVSLFGDEIGWASDEEELDPEIDSFYFDEVREWPRKPEGYDFRANESYKKYRKHIERLTIKKTDEQLLDYFNKTIHYFLTEDNCHQIGPHLLSIRQELLTQRLFSTTFNPDFFAISKGFHVANRTMDDYADELLLLLGYLFGCTTHSITAGHRQPTVFAGHPNHVQLACKTYHYLDAFLSDEVKRFAAQCHKNTKRKNRLMKAKWHGCHLVGTMLNSIIDEDEHYMLLPQSEYETLSQYAYQRVHEYFDEHEPLGGWWDPKKHPFR